nr:Uncharacterised protein [Klebsiella pneumoniae]
MGAKVRGIRRAKANLDRIIKDVRGVKSCEQSSLRCLLAVRRLRFTPDRYVDAYQQPVPRNHG